MYNIITGLHYIGYLGHITNMFDWFTLDWLMNNLEWAVAVLVVGCVILLFFPILLGWQLKNSANKKENE